MHYCCNSGFEEPGQGGRQPGPQGDHYSQPPGHRHGGGSARGPTGETQY